MNIDSYDWVIILRSLRDSLRENIAGRNFWKQPSRSSITEEERALYYRNARANIREKIRIVRQIEFSRERKHARSWGFKPPKSWNALRALRFQKRKERNRQPVIP